MAGSKGEIPVRQVSSKLSFSHLVIISWLLLVLSAVIFELQPDQINLRNILHPPGENSFFGQDELGRPVFDRLAAGAAVSMTVAIGVTLVSTMVGILVGAFSAWKGDKIDQVIVRIIDFFMAFPGLLLAIALAGILGPGINNLVIALSAVGWVGFARLTRAQVLVIKHRDHIYAAKALGSSSAKILFQHLLPLIVAPLIIEATFLLASVVIAEAGLSFLGIGIQPPQASWGNMIREGTSYLLVAPHLVLIPGVSLALVVLAINQLGDQFRDKLDRKL